MLRRIQIAESTTASVFRGSGERADARSGGQQVPMLMPMREGGVKDPARNAVHPSPAIAKPRLLRIRVSVNPETRIMMRRGLIPGELFVATAHFSMVPGLKFSAKQLH